MKGSVQVGQQLTVREVVAALSLSVPTVRFRIATFCGEARAPKKTVDRKFIGLLTLCTLHCAGL
jgi:hypothetical protein